MSELKNAAKLVYTSTPPLQCISTENPEKCTGNPIMFSLAIWSILVIIISHVL